MFWQQSCICLIKHSMKSKHISALVATAFAINYGHAKADDSPNYKTISSFEEIQSNTIYYGFNKVTPQSSQMQVINQHIDALRNDPDTYIRVSSHTDHIGSWEVNLNVSRKRAIAIAEYLREYGIPQDRIVLNWLGEDSPKYFKEGEKHKNRRSHIRIFKKVNKQIQISSLPFESPVYKKVATSKPVVTTMAKPSPSKVVTPTPPVIIENKVEEKVEAKVEPIITSIKPEAKETKKLEKPNPVEEVKTEKVLTYQKNILFVDASTMEPIQVNVDLLFDGEKSSFESSEDGSLHIKSHNTAARKMDVYAYGYFHKSIIVKPGSFQQIIKLNPTKAGNKIALNNLEFVAGKSRLMESSKEEIEKLYNTLMNNPHIKIEIGGHINEPNKKPRRLSKEHFQISVNRAKSVYNYLDKKGISKDRMTYKGYGNSEMLYPKPKNEDQQAKNRRVEIKVL